MYNEKEFPKKFYIITNVNELRHLVDEEENCLLVRVFGNECILLKVFNIQDAYAIYWYKIDLKMKDYDYGCLFSTNVDGSSDDMDSMFNYAKGNIISFEEVDNKYIIKTDTYAVIEIEQMLDNRLFPEVLLDFECGITGAGNYNEHDLDLV